jgi:hypothetical protein
MSRYGERTRIGEAVSGFGRPAGGAGFSPIPTIVTFTSTGANNYTVPAGVTYIVANIQAAGGGAGGGGTLPASGGDSSVAFTAGTKTANGGIGNGSSSTNWSSTTGLYGNVATPYTPQEFGGGGYFIGYAANGQGVSYQGGFGAFIRTGGVVAPADTLVVTVGAGGAAGSYGQAGQQGIVTLELYEGNTRRVDTFQSGGTFTPPAGVTKVQAWIVGGGGGVGGIDGAGTAGGNSSVAFASGTITSNGGATILASRLGFDAINHKVGGAPNSGIGGMSVISTTSSPSGGHNARAGNGQRRLVSAAVTPLTGITVTIGAGGNNEGGTTGGSGVVWFEYTV